MAGKYQQIKKLGEGGFGKVYLVREKKNAGQLAVMKEVNLSQLDAKGIQDAVKEASFLAKMRHPNIIGYKEYYRAQVQGKGRFGRRMPTPMLYIIMDYADGGDLESKIKERRGRYFAERQVVEWFVQICLAIKHIHDRKILHRDIKSQNIFLTRNGMVKLGDFGIARNLSHTFEKARTQIGTPYYLSPEMCQEKPYDNKSDIWALGVVLYEMMMLKHPFLAQSMQGLVRRIVQAQYTPVPSRNYSSELRQLGRDLLKKDPRSRPNINEILQRPFIRAQIAKFLDANSIQEEFSHTVIHSNPMKNRPAIPPKYVANAQYQNQNVNITNHNYQNNRHHLPVHSHVPYGQRHNQPPVVQLFDPRQDQGQGARASPIIQPALDPSSFQPAYKPYGANARAGHLHHQQQQLEHQRQHAEQQKALGREREREREALLRQKQEADRQRQEARRIYEAKRREAYEKAKRDQQLLKEMRERKRLMALKAARIRAAQEAKAMKERAVQQAKARAQKRAEQRAMAEKRRAEFRQAREEARRNKLKVMQDLHGGNGMFIPLDEDLENNSPSRGGGSKGSRGGSRGSRGGSGRSSPDTLVDGTEASSAKPSIKRKPSIHKKHKDIDNRPPWNNCFEPIQHGGTAGNNENTDNIDRTIARSISDTNEHKGQVELDQNGVEHVLIPTIVRSRSDSQSDASSQARGQQRKQRRRRKKRDAIPDRVVDEDAENARLAKFAHQQYLMNRAAAERYKARALEQVNGSSAAPSPVTPAASANNQAKSDSNSNQHSSMVEKIKKKKKMSKMEFQQQHEKQLSEIRIQYFKERMEMQKKQQERLRAMRALRGSSDSSSSPSVDSATNDNSSDNSSPSISTERGCSQGPSSASDGTKTQTTVITSKNKTKQSTVTGTKKGDVLAQERKAYFAARRAQKQVEENERRVRLLRPDSSFDKDNNTTNDNDDDNDDNDDNGDDGEYGADTLDDKTLPQHIVGGDVDPDIEAKIQRMYESVKQSVEQAKQAEQEQQHEQQDRDQEKIETTATTDIKATKDEELDEEEEEELSSLHALHNTILNEIEVEKEGAQDFCAMMQSLRDVLKSTDLDLDVQDMSFVSLDSEQAGGSKSPVDHQAKDADKPNDNDDDNVDDDDDEEVDEIVDVDELLDNGYFRDGQVLDNKDNSVLATVEDDGTLVTLTGRIIGMVPSQDVDNDEDEYDENDTDDDVLDNMSTLASLSSLDNNISIDPSIDQDGNEEIDPMMQTFGNTQRSGLGNILSLTRASLGMTSSSSAIKQDTHLDDSPTNQQQAQGDSKSLALSDSGHNDNVVVDKNGDDDAVDEKTTAEQVQELRAVLTKQLGSSLLLDIYLALRTISPPSSTSGDAIGDGAGPKTPAMDSPEYRGYVQEIVASLLAPDQMQYLTPLLTLLQLEDQISKARFNHLL